MLTQGRVNRLRLASNSILACSVLPQRRQRWLPRHDDRLWSVDKARVAMMNGENQGSSSRFAASLRYGWPDRFIKTINPFHLSTDQIARRSDYRLEEEHSGRCQ